METELTVTTIDLLRHGECEGGNIFRGSADVALSQTGWQTMQRAVARLSGEQVWDQIITSPLRRCRLFAEEVGRKHAIPCSVAGELGEFDFGDWEGEEISRVETLEPDRLAQLRYEAGTFTAPGGESIQQFQQRVLTGWQRLMRQHQGRHLLLVVHGGIIKVLLTGLLSIPLDRISSVYVPYGCCSRLQVHHQDQGSQVYLLYHNGPAGEVSGE